LLVTQNVLGLYPQEIHPSEGVQSIFWDIDEKDYTLERVLGIRRAEAIYLGEPGKSQNVVMAGTSA
jgi:hypothetical protein